MRRSRSPVFTAVIKDAYGETVHWLRNLFTVPSRSAGKSFVLELAYLFFKYAEAKALKSIALKTAMVLPIFLLQKPSAGSKANDHVECLDWQMKLVGSGH